MSTIFVCGATGTQGGAVTDHLLQKGIKVHTITRDPTSPAAQKLQSNGVSVFKGDFNDESSIRASFKGCTGVFLNLMPDLTNVHTELQQAKRIISLAKEAGATHLIYSSGFSVDNPERMKHWDPNTLVGTILLSKQTIENEIRTSGYKHWTILRPGNFATNYLLPQALMYGDFVKTGRYTTAMTPETKIAMVDPYDIGKFALGAFSDPARFHTQEIAISTELLTVEDVLGALAKASGKSFKAVFMSQEEIEAESLKNPFMSAQLFMRDMAQFADSEKTRSWGFTLGTFEEFLERNKEGVLSTYTF